MNRQDFERYALAKKFSENIAETWLEAFTAILSSTARPVDQIRFLDYGCGDGKYFRRLLACGLSPANVHGVDVSKIRIERCRAFGWERTMHIQVGQRLPYPDDHFDIVNFMEVIEHIPAGAIDAALAEIRRVVSPEGILIVSTPNYPIKRLYDICDAILHKKWARLKDDPTHVTRYNHAKLHRLLARHFAHLTHACYKPGFLYRKMSARPLMHKMMFVCSGKTNR